MHACRDSPFDTCMCWFNAPWSSIKYVTVKLCNTPAQVERWLCTRRARSCRPNRTRRWSSLRSRWTSPCSTAPCASAPWIVVSQRVVLNFLWIVVVCSNENRKGQALLWSKKINRPYIFISLAISRSRCYIGPLDLISRSVLSDFLFSLLNLSRVRHSHAIKQRLGRH